ncbi:phosphoglucosamine mutase [Phorcysia thermohydrogeniphila]|uniref:Phosphoglucosamine mutase n=1 Tax=Phorcysia thermohydrogeniphila TaxID=936138 RepID=A0A4R1GHH0_9BACT|nr:phosphoglucosamine mutase [Phorcysia thermohydrogeniphila]TCK06491.1 phosphoglucosamine mutase [Phorcysia thermohydrogeniphila]
MKAKRKLFGTDGIRGIANKYPLTPEMVQKIGIAYGVYLNAKFPDERHTVVIGKDTRLSSDMIKSAFISGLTATGVDVIDVGTVPTPAISYFVREGNLSGGVMVSASHNPYEYNGLKFFTREGKKFSEVEEGGLELVVFNKYELPKALPENIGRVFDGENLVESYEKHLESAGRYLAGLKIGIDCANGATFQIAPQVFRSLGARVFVFNAEPDGKNINEGCGALHPEFIAQKVRDLNLHMGFAFDGDGDRCIAVDENGNIVDGDKLIAILAAHYAQKSKEVVATVMSNMGLEVFLKEMGLNLHRTPVGDRFVAEKMDEVGALVGGEQSGHVIIKEFSETGDGILTAILIASIAKSVKKPLSQLASMVKTFPQKLKNIRVKEKPPLEKLEKLQNAIKEAEEKLAGKGRVLVRYSGTEPVLRIMVEAEDENLIDVIIEDLQKAVKEEGIAL